MLAYTNVQANIGRPPGWRFYLSTIVVQSLVIGLMWAGASINLFVQAAPPPLNSRVEDGPTRKWPFATASNGSRSDRQSGAVNQWSLTANNGWWTCSNGRRKTLGGKDPATSIVERGLALIRTDAEGNRSRQGPLVNAAARIKRNLPQQVEDVVVPGPMPCQEYSEGMLWSPATRALRKKPPAPALVS